LDVREDLKRGREPFSKIMQAVAGLQANDKLLLIAPFEPAPLYRVLREQGFAHESKMTPEGDWQVLFSRMPDASASVKGAGQAGTQSSRRRDDRIGKAAVVEIDARGLEPPEPLVRILESLAKLPAGAILRARTDRRPMHLYAQVEERGFRARSQEESDGSFVTDISLA
jgi:uncharacterized protein (DUF2249 family)